MDKLSGAEITEEHGVNLRFKKVKMVAFGEKRPLSFNFPGPSSMNRLRGFTMLQSIKSVLLGMEFSIQF